MATAVRNRKGQFVKRSKSSSSTALARRPSSSPARRSSPYAVASRRRRSSSGGALPVKEGMTGVGIGLATVKFKTTIDRLPKIGGTPLVAAAGLAHLMRRQLPAALSKAPEGLAYIAGYEVGKNNAGAWGISGKVGDDDF